MHPAADRRGYRLRVSHRDFRLLCSLSGRSQRRRRRLPERRLRRGSAGDVSQGVVSAVRNLGRPLADFTTVNSRFRAALPSARQCGRAPACQRSGGAGYCHHGPPRVDDPPAGGGSLIEKEPGSEVRGLREKARNVRRAAPRRGPRRPGAFRLRDARTRRRKLNEPGARPLAPGPCSAPEPLRGTRSGAGPGCCSCSVGLARPVHCCAGVGGGEGPPGDS